MRCGSSGRNKLLRIVFVAKVLATVVFVFTGSCRADPIPAATEGSESSATSPPPIPRLFSGTVELGLGSSDLSGDFGSDRTTNIAAVVATATYRSNGLRLIASLPWMRIDSPGAIFTGIEGTPIIANSSVIGGRRLRQGVGDLTLGGSYLLPDQFTHGIDTDLSFRVKLPTASDSSRLSTGQVDYSFGTTFTKPIGRFAPLASIFYRSFGDGPQFQLKNGFATSVGTTYAFSPNIIGFLTYDYAQRASRYIADAHQITTSLSFLLPRSPVRLTSFVAGGLSRGAPAISAGLALSLRL